MAVSCVKEQKVDIVPDKPGQVEVSDTTSPLIAEKQVSLHAIVAEDKETKVLADNAGAFKWQNGDHITVVTAADVIRQFETTDTGIEADFSGTIPDADNVGKYALYPASDNHLVDGDDILFHLDNEVVWSSNTTNMPMLGKISGSGAGFKAVGGVLKLVLYNIPSTAKYLQFVATKQITGDFEIADAKLSGITINTGATDKSADKELLINFSSDYDENMVFYIPLPVGVIGGFTLNILDESYDELFTQSTKPGVELTIAANHLVLGPSLNCAVPAADDVLSSTDITSSELAGSYGNVTIDSATGKTWRVNACKQSDFLQLRSGSSSHIELPTYSDNIKSITLKNTRNSAVTPAAYSGTLSFRKEAVDGAVVTSKSFSSLSLGDDITISIPSGYKTGFITTSAGLRIDGITVAFEAPEANKPIISTGVSTLTVSIGATSASTTASITNPLDDLGIGFEIKDASSDWISGVTLDEGVLRLTASVASNPNPDDNTATLVLRASGAANKEVALKQNSALVRKPATITAVEGNASFTATWTKAAHSASYLAYLHPAETATPESGGTELTPSLDGSTYTVSSSGLTNGSTYYLYVKVATVDANYVAEDSWTMVSITPAATIYYERINDVSDIESGARYLIVNESAGVAFNGGINSSSYDVTGNTISVSAAGGQIVSNNMTDNASFTISGSTDHWVIRSAAGYYIKRADYSNGIDADNVTPVDNTITFSSNDAVITNSTSGTVMYLRYNSAADQRRFRFYKSNTSVDPVQLYKYVEPRTPAGIEWQKSGVLATTDTGVLRTGDDTMPTASLSNPNSLTVSYSSSNTDVATIHSSSGAITLVGAGDTEISAEFAGDATYAPSIVTYTLTVTDSRSVCATPTFSPGESALAGTTDITISSTTTGSTIYYTTDGTTPTTSSAHGTAGTKTAVVSVTPPTTLKAIAVLSDYQNSAVASAEYSTTSGPEKLADPAGISITNISIADKQFTGSWSAVANATGYHWRLCNNSTEPASDGDANVIAYGDEASTSFSKTVATAPTPGVEYYLYVQAKGNGVSYSDSDYAFTHAALYDYVFNSNSWGATMNSSAANWSSGAAGNALTAGQGIQVTVAKSGANGSSPKTFTGVSKIVVTYCTNGSSGAGSIKVQVGSGTEKTFSVTKPASGGTTLKTTTFNFNPSESGRVKVTGICTTNSVYIYGVSILCMGSSNSLSGSAPTGWLEMPSYTTPEMSGTTTSSLTDLYERTHSATMGGKTQRNYSILYDPEMYASYWVAYPLCSDHITGSGRANAWAYDPDVPNAKQTNCTAGAYGVNISTPNYADNHYARGHQIANADRNGVDDMCDQTYFMTNITPQIQNGFNGGIWSQLEGGVRNLTSSCDTVYVVTGAAFRKKGGGEVINTIVNTRDSKTLPVPNYYWKALLKVTWSAGKVTDALAIGFWLPHQDLKGESYTDSKYVVSVDQIEEWTGFDLFSNLSTDLQTSAEANTSWSDFRVF